MQLHQQIASARLARPLRMSLIAAAIVIAWSCGGATSTNAPAQGTRFPLTITEAGGNTVTIAHKPSHIVSLSPTATEMLFAIGAGPQVVAVDDQSNYPANAPMTKLSGFEPNIEAIAAYSPDLVVAAEDQGGLVHGLGALNVPVLLEPAAKNLDGSYAQLKELGAATGHTGDAEAEVGKMRSQISSVLASLPRPAKQLKVYHELDDTFYSATSTTFIGQVYSLLGLKNIADGATAAAPDYPQLSAEYIISSSPDLIVLADTKCCHQDLSSVAARPGWSAIRAVHSGQVVGVDDDIASRWGPRVVDFLQALAPHVRQAGAQAA